MNIRITHNWLLEYLDTDATPYEIQKYLSLSGPSIERVEKIGEDYVYDIEIITNRIDTASVLGIAQEAVAILPMFGKRAKLRLDPLQKYRFEDIVGNRHACSLQIKITNQILCSRFAAVVLDNIRIKPSPDFMKERLIAAGIKSINNVVDISNYLMLSLGQPVHVFDYDRIAKSTMIMRESKKDENIVTLDEKKVSLPGGDIVIEDGSGNLIDLCGIMGGLNSAVSVSTKRIVLFVQTYNKEKIRKTTMTTGVRTVAATFFEKGLDEERVEPTTAYGVELLEKHAGGKVASKIYDLYPHPYQEKTIEMEYAIFDTLIGVKIDKKIIQDILRNLGFEIASSSSQSLAVTIPSYRRYDISIPEDLVEEVARVYGYHKLPNNLSPASYVQQPEEFEKLFEVTSKIKYFLKHLGLTEVINYSMVSKELLKDFGLPIKDHLRLSNTISEEIEYMRTTLLPSLYKNIRDNRGKHEILKFFEIGKVYLPVGNRHACSLPQEIYKLAIAVNTDYFDLKGIVQAMLLELHISEIDLLPEIDEKSYYHKLFLENIQATTLIKKMPVGCSGQFKSGDSIYLAEFDLEALVRNYKTVPTYRPINPYAMVKLDLTIPLSEKMNFISIKKIAINTSSLVQKIELIDLFENNATVRFYFSSSQKNITEEEAKKELKKINLAIKSS